MVNDIFITEHAIDKMLFEANRQGYVVPESREAAQKALLLMFEKSKKEKMNPGLIKRIIDNGFKETFYYRLGKWRFVIVEGRMITCEISTFNDYYKDTKSKLYKLKE